MIIRCGYILFNSDNFVCYYAGAHPKPGGDYGSESVYYALTAKPAHKWPIDWIGTNIFNNDGWIVLGVYRNEKEAEDALDLLLDAFAKGEKVFRVPGRVININDFMNKEE